MSHTPRASLRYRHRATGVCRVLEFCRGNSIDELCLSRFDNDNYQLSGLTPSGGRPGSEAYAYDPVRRLTNIVSAAGGFTYSYRDVANSLNVLGTLVDNLALQNRVRSQHSTIVQS